MSMGGCCSSFNFLNQKVMTFLKKILPAFILLVLVSACDEQAPDPIESEPAWQTITSSNQPMERHEHAYVAVGDLFYLVGGRNERPVQVYNPASNSWDTRSAPPFQMHHFQAVAYQNKIYVMGAFTEGFPYEKPIPNIYIYDPATDEWSEGPEIPEDRRRGGAGVVVYQDQFYIVSGIQNGHADGHVTWLDRYNPATGEWTQLADAPRARDHFHAVEIDGKLYAAAGRRSSFATNQTIQLTMSEVDVYDFATDTWTTLPASSNLPTERAGVAAVAYQGKLVVLGGESARRVPGADDPQPAHNEVEAFNPQTQQWETMAPMNQGRHGIQALVHGDNIYVAAGSKTLGGNEINSHEVYIP